MQMDTRPSSTNLLYRDRLANNLKDLSSFNHLNRKTLKRLFEKKLGIQKFGPSYFFSNIYEIFAVLTEGSIKETQKIKNSTIEFIKRVKDWSAVHADLAFLNCHSEIVEYYLDDPDNPIFIGLIMFILCTSHHYTLKLYQLQEGNTLVSCQIGLGDVKENLLRLAVLVSPNGALFGILTKNLAPVQQNVPISLTDFTTIENDTVGSFDNYLESLNNFDQALLKEEPRELNEYDEHILKLIISNLGLSPHFFIDHAEYMRHKYFNSIAEKELKFLVNNIVKSVSTKSCQKISNLSTNESLQNANSGSELKDGANAHADYVTKQLNLQQNWFNPYTSNAQNFKQIQDMHNEPQVAKSMADISSPQDNDDAAPKQNNSSINQFVFANNEANATHDIKPSRFTVPNLNDMEANRSPKTAYMAHSVINLSNNFPIERVKAPVNTMQEMPVTSKKPVVLDQGKDRHIGRLKFYNEKKTFGFLVKESDNSDVFFHLSDMEATGINVNSMLNDKDLRFSFVEMLYKGKTGVSKKAVNIKLIYE